MRWTEVKTSWSSDWQVFAFEAERQWSARVAATPSRYLEPVTATLNELTLTRRYLDYIASVLSSPVARQADRDNCALLLTRYNTLAAGVYAEAQPAPGFGVAPAVAGGLVVMGLFISIAGIVFAIAAYEYCVNLREQTALADRELTERVRASEQGRALQTSTLPAPASNNTLPDTNGVAAGALLVLVAAGGVAWLARRN